jgi:hypothetical protein
MCLGVPLIRYVKYVIVLCRNATQVLKREEQVGQRKSLTRVLGKMIAHPDEVK